MSSKLTTRRAKDLRKVDVVKYRREISELTRRRTSLHKRRTILSSPKGLQLISVITPFVIERLISYESVCSSSLLNLSITNYTSKKKPKLEQKQEKEEIVPKNFDSIYSAVNAKLKTSNNKHLIDLILSSPRIGLSQSENFILDNRDTKESIVDFVCALKQKVPTFPIFTLPFWKQLKFHLNLLPTRMPKRKTEELGSFSKSEKVSLNRLYSRGRAAHGSVRNLSKASGLSKKKVEQFFQTKTSYTKFGPPIRRFRRLQAFSKYIK